MKTMFSFLAITTICVIVLFANASAQVFTSPRAVENNKYVYMNVVMNCHDFSQVRTSYQTLSRLFGMYRKYNIVADFYFTDMLAQRLEWSFPGFLDSLRRAGMGINIHHRSPHAITFRPTRREAENPQLGVMTLFRQGRTDEAIEECEKWERRRVNVATGGLDSAAGGYDFLEQKAGTKPTCVGFGISGNFDGDSIAIGAMISLKKSGLRATVDDHEGGADAQFPFMSLRGVLSRPADSSITRWTAGTMRRDTFWWKMVLTPDADAYSPRRYAERLMSQVSKTQLTLMNAIMHETDFSYDRPPFYSVYYVSGTAGATNPVPYDTNAFPTDRIIPWSQAQKDAIWTKYDSLMQYIGSHPNIRTMTMQSLVQTLSDDRERGITREQCRNLASQISSGVMTTLLGMTIYRMPTKNFFTIPQTTEYFSLADAYYALQRSLADYARTGRLPESLNLRDLVPPLGNGAGLGASSTLTFADVLQAARQQDSLLTLQISRNQYGGRMPSNVSIGGRLLNPVEYFALLARAYQSADGSSATASASISAQQIPVPAALTPPVGDAPSQNGPSNWAVKPIRRLAAMATAVRNNESISPNTTALTISPNPAQNLATVSFSVEQSQRVSLKVFNVLGQEIATILDENLSAGEHALSLTPQLPHGTYLIRLQMGNVVQQRSVVFQR
ncbi:MAG: T9SS C-terminal target domain-containing protein [Candidatus Kapaibacterium sp.]|nr:MAG: T9SS C-terminal target domain-containing protein [Candidatus Kapabacteria bacterium]